jgi:hypothetical protein
MFELHLHQYVSLVLAGVTVLPTSYSGLLAISHSKFFSVCFGLQH